MGVSFNGGTPKMDGENNGKPYFLMDDLGVKPTIFGNLDSIRYASKKNLKSFALAEENLSYPTSTPACELAVVEA